MSYNTSLQPVTLILWSVSRPHSVNIQWFVLKYHIWWQFNSLINWENMTNQSGLLPRARRGHVDRALAGQTHYLCRTSPHISQILNWFLIEELPRKSENCIQQLSLCRVFKMFSVIAPWQSFLPWSGLYIMDCHEIIIACLWTNQLVEAEGNYFLCVLLSAHRTLAPDNGPAGRNDGEKRGMEPKRRRKAL